MAGDGGTIAIVNGLVLRSAEAEPEPIDIVVANGRIEALQPHVRRLLPNC
jgi:hypothetical protein